MSRNYNPDQEQQPWCVFVTGGTGLVGRKLIERLLSDHHQVVFSSSSQHKIDELLAEHPREAKQQQLHSLQVDLTTSDATTVVSQFLTDRHLSPTGLVHAARSISNLATKGQPDLTREKWLQEYLLDVVVPYELSMAMASVPNSRLNSIVNIASMYGVVAHNPHLYKIADRQTQPTMANYSVAKAAVIHLSKVLAVDLQAHSVRVNTVSFGGIEGRVDDDFKKRYAQLTPSERMLGQDEVVGPIMFLLSAESSALTGHNLIADGGWTTW